MEKTNDYSFEFSPLAAENLEKIIRYISFDLKNKKAAEQLVLSINNKLNNLSLFPYSYPIYENSEYRKKQIIRKASLKSFLLLFEIDENYKKIIIVAVVHSKTVK